MVCEFIDLFSGNSHQTKTRLNMSLAVASATDAFIVRDDQARTKKLQTDSSAHESRLDEG